MLLRRIVEVIAILKIFKLNQRFFIKDRWKEKILLYQFETNRSAKKIRRLKLVLIIKKIFNSAFFSAERR